MHLLILNGTPDDRWRAARTHIPSTHRAFALDTSTLPFVRVEDVAPSPGAVVLLLDDIERAFPDRQTRSTRLVLTQSTYLLQTWIDRLDDGDRIVATADRQALERCAPEAFEARGPWARFGIIEIAQTEVTKGTTGTEGVVMADTTSVPVAPLVSSIGARLAAAFAASQPAERLALCREAVSLAGDSAAAWLALASAYRETGDGRAAREALDRAAALAPDWEAIAYESGKLSLVYDDLPRARAAFQRAADLRPSFAAACSNLGATLGELDEPEAALQAFRQALAHDPRAVTVLNNIGVVCRQLGRLEESEAALQRAIAADPRFVFAHYNLGHTLFLAGRYAEAQSAYEGGRAVDPQQNRRQGCRLAVVRLANGDPSGAERDLWHCVNGAAADEREDLLLEAYEIASALLTQQPASDQTRAFLERIGAEIAKSE